MSGNWEETRWFVKCWNETREVEVGHAGCASAVTVVGIPPFLSSDSFQEYATNLVVVILVEIVTATVAYDCGSVRLRHSCRDSKADEFTKQ